MRVRTCAALPNIATNIHTYLWASARRRGSLELSSLLFLLCGDGGKLLEAARDGDLNVLLVRRVEHGRTRRGEARRLARAREEVALVEVYLHQQQPTLRLE